MIEMKLIDGGIFVSYITIDESTIKRIHNRKTIPYEVVDTDFNHSINGYTRDSNLFLNGKLIGTIEEIIDKYGAHRPDLVASLYQIPQLKFPVEYGILDYETLEGDVLIIDLDDLYSDLDYFFYRFITDMYYDDRLGVYNFVQKSDFNNVHGDIHSTSQFILAENGAYFTYSVEHQ